MNIVEDRRKTKEEHNNEGKRKMGIKKQKSKFKKFLTIVVDLIIIGGAGIKRSNRIFPTIWTI